MEDFSLTIAVVKSVVVDYSEFIIAYLAKEDLLPSAQSIFALYHCLNDCIDAYFKEKEKIANDKK